MTARTPSVSARTTRAPHIARKLSVSCTSWPPGAERMPCTWPAAYSSGVRTSSTYRDLVSLSPRHRASVAASIRLIPSRLATFSAAARASSAYRFVMSGGLLWAPWITSRPARCQAIVPSLSETTLFGTPALMSDCAPMMLRVRPPQFTMTVVSGEGTRSLKR